MKKHYIIYGSLILIIMLLFWFNRSKNGEVNDLSMDKSVLQSSFDASEVKRKELATEITDLKAITARQEEKVTKDSLEIVRLKARKLQAKTTVIMKDCPDSLRFYLVDGIRADSIIFKQGIVISELAGILESKDNVIILTSSDNAILESQISDLQNINTNDSTVIGKLRREVRKQERRKRFFKGLSAGLGIAVAVLAVSVGL